MRRFILCLLAVSSTAARISVVTGAAGFLGHAIAGRLARDGDHVRAVILRGDPLNDELRSTQAGNPNFEIIEADVTAIESLRAAFSGADRIFHSAALVHAWAPIGRFRAVNVGGMQNVARLAKELGVRRLVAVSTTDVFGIARDGRAMDESSPYQSWDEPYADTKIEAEKWLWQFAKESGLDVAVIYPGWIYGPGDRAFFPGLAEAIDDGFLLMWFRDIRLAWAYIDNMVDGCLLASTHPAAVGQGFIIHDGMDGPTLEDTCMRIADSIGARRPSVHIPYSVAFGAAWMCQKIWRGMRLKGGPPLRTVDIKAFGYQWALQNEKAKRLLGWTPNVSTTDGMERALESLRAFRSAQHETKS